MTSLYRSESSNPKWNAQRNLMGRTHYVDDDTLRFHKARVLSARHIDGGLLFSIVESVALTYNGNKRGFRFVVFDLFGHIVGERADLDHTWTSSEAASKAMWAELDKLDAIAITEEGIARETKAHLRDMDELRTAIKTRHGKETP